jgi:DNA topoisomerase-6 subunit B
MASTHTAAEMAASQREISVSEFFLKNRHLLGFDSPAKALLTTVKEAVDNALDACEEAGIVPEIWVEVAHSYWRDTCYRVAVEDNGPGIVEGQIARIFGKLLYGSKFHKLSQSRGQQGMGISAAGMYGQLTSGEPMRILSRVAEEELASELIVSIDTKKNKPDIHRKKRVPWQRPHGTRVEVEMEGHYHQGPHSIGMYLKQTALANPHVTLHFQDPDGARLCFTRSTTQLPPRPVEIKPHPQGIELGLLIQMLSATRSHTLLHFLEDEFSRVGRKTAQQIVRQAGQRLSERSSPKRIAHAQASALYQAIKNTRVSAPRTDCLVPIGEERLTQGLHKELAADFYTVVTRPPAVYRGNPFVVEVGIAYGKPGRVSLEWDTDGHLRKTRHASKTADQDGQDQQDQQDQQAQIGRADEPAHLVRFANRVPLPYQQAGCAITKAVTHLNWRTYGLLQPKGSLPIAPLVIVVHLASVWVPFTSEAKEAIASYPEILKELTLGLQECGRRLASYVRRGARLKHEYETRTYIEKYLPHVGLALQEILGLSEAETERTVHTLNTILQQRRRSGVSSRVAPGPARRQRSR